jgi:hypothetical protein
MKRFVEFLNEKTLSPLEKTGKAVGFPSGEGRRSTNAMLDWRKRGGNAGDKTVWRVLNAAKDLGWKERDAKQSTHVAYDTVNNDIVYVDPEGQFCLSGNIFYGQASYENRFSLTLTYNDTRTHSKD